MPTDKRARQKVNREAALAERRAEERKRRIARFAVIGVILAVVVILAIFTGGNDKGGSSGPGGGTDAAIACGGPTPPQAAPKQYTKPPDFTLDAGVDYSALISTSCGDIKMDLDEKDSPKNVANFIFLAREGFYDGLIWHRVEPNSVIQSGDPDGSALQQPNGPGYSVPDEPPAKANEYIYGVVGIANLGQPNTGGSQFFIITHDPPSERSPGKDPEPAGYQPIYTIIGSVDPSSYDVIDTISNQKTDQGATDPAEAVKPIVPVYINSVEIIEN
jgi:cyclophilin family peptidyl-prolyl cis-trans isomerase